MADPTLFDHLNWHLKSRWHAWVARGVLATPPLVPKDDGVVLFSMIGTAVVLPYLIAVKSLHANLKQGRVVILDDGTLTSQDRATLARHLGDPRIIAIADVATGDCPSGSCWERLLALMDLRLDDYVIQLDSDTVTTGPVPEVAAAIADQRSFTLRGEVDAQRTDCATFVAAQTPGDPLSPATHVQSAAELVIDRVRLPDLPVPYYVRGCAGFAGFAPAAAGRAVVERFSAEMDRLLGRALWDRWGAEQVASNFMVANDPDPILLSYDRYLNFWNQELGDRVRFVHFIGTCRFDGRAYLNATRAAIRALKA